MDIKRVDLIQQLVDKHGYTKKAATSIVDDFTDIILYNLGNGDTVSIHNFDVPAHWIPRFYPGNKMRLAVKLWEDSTKRGLM